MGDITESPRMTDQPGRRISAWQAVTEMGAEITSMAYNLLRLKLSIGVELAEV
jgi:hypothetical protein